LRFRLNSLGKVGAAGVSSTLLAAIAFVPAAHATTNVTVTTYAGADRYGTSADIAEAKYPTGVPSGHVILASGANFPDALAANYLAGQETAPVLLTPADSSDPAFSETTAALAKLLTGTTKDVTIVGGTAAVAADVATALSGDGYTVNQVGGATRFDTAEMIDETSGLTVGTGKSNTPTAIIATGDNYPDALAAGPLAWNKHFPVILTDGQQTTLSSQASSALTTLGIKNVLIMGGSSAINPAINTAITGMGITIEKQFAGADRTDTAGQFENYIIANYGASNNSVILASGGNFPDALSAGALGGDLKGIVLTEPDLTLGTYTPAVLAGLSSTSTLFVVGGTSAVPTATVTAAQGDFASTSASGGVTVLPELLSATIASTTTQSNCSASNPPGTLVRFVFDSPVTVNTVDDFLISDATGASYVPGTDPTDGTPPGNPACAGTTAPNTGAFGTTFPDFIEASGQAVDVLYPNFDTASLAGSLTLADVAYDAVTNSNGVNPAGSAALGTSSSTSLTANVTNAPDATAAAFRAGVDSEHAAVDITWDKAASVNAGSASLVTLDGVSVPCTLPTAGPPVPASGGTGAGGDNTTTWTLACGSIPSGTYLDVAPSASNIARVVFAEGTAVDSTDAFDNGVEQVSVASNGATIDLPDLTGATFTEDATDAGGNTVDEAVYTFDTQLNATVTGDTDFGVTGLNGGADSVMSTATGPFAGDAPVVKANQVLVYFPAGTLADATQAFVNADAVTESTGILGENLAGEVGAVAASAVTTSAGHTALPDLSAVKIFQSTAGFGGYTASFVFDKAGPSSTLTTPGDFHLFDSDGVELTCIAGTVSTTTNSDDTMTCTSWDLAGTTSQTPVTPATAGTTFQVQNAVLGTVDGDAASVTANPAYLPDNPANFGVATTGGTGTPVVQ
jgi:putative cell wall-binding protein/uncharacterized membrane protein YeaQ/YmgE (transglycosylase-associated protein family)